MYNYSQKRTVIHIYVIVFGFFSEFYACCLFFKIYYEIEQTRKYCNLHTNFASLCLMNFCLDRDFRHNIWFFNKIPDATSAAEQMI